MNWYDSNRKSYPWRSTKNPYKILVTEMLLRKTTRVQVKKIFPIFFKKFPTLKKLAAANRKEVVKIINPLGMEKIRSKLLKKSSLTIIKKHGGRVPLNKTDLLDLPGVGEYTANAVLLFVKKEKVSLVDTNTKRVVERVFLGSHNSKTRVNVQTYEFVDALLPIRRYVDFNLALLDFANAVCLPKKPLCSLCPIKNSCKYYCQNIIK